MIFVVERFDVALLESVGDRRLDRRVERLLGIDIDHGLVQESFFVQPIGVLGGRR